MPRVYWIKYSVADRLQAGDFRFGRNHRCGKFGDGIGIWAKPLRCVMDQNLRTGGETVQQNDNYEFCQNIIFYHRNLCF